VTFGLCSEFERGAPTTSNVNFARGQTVTGLAMVALDQGAMCAYTSAPAHVIVDVQAELTADRTVGILPVAPTRLHDSRTP
jgi:hypothetical protein